MRNAPCPHINVNRPRCFHAAFTCLIAAAVSAAVDTAAAAEWKTLNPPSEGFSCQMPGEAKPLTQNIDTSAGANKVVLYIVELADSAYLVNSTKIPANAIEATTNERLDNARDGAVTNSKGKLVEEQKISLQGHPGRQLLIEQPGGLFTQLRVVIAQDRVIQAFVVSKTDRDAALKTFKTLTAPDEADKKQPPDSKKFFDSFKLVN